MRISEAGVYRNFISDLQNLNENLTLISQQVSSGKKLNQLSDSPTGSAELISLVDLAAGIDQYQSSSNTVSYFLRVADSALNEVSGLVASVYAKGSNAATGTVSDNERANLAADIRMLRDQILTLANSQVRGRYVFAGSMVTDAPFVLEGDSVQYQGNGDVMRVNVDQGTEVQTGVPGSDAFGPLFAAVEGLLAAIDSNDPSAITDALGLFRSAESALGLARGTVGANLSLLENVNSQLQSRETILTDRRSRIEDANMLEAVIRLRQAQTALQTTLSAGGSILPQRNLFDFLG